MLRQRNGMAHHRIYKYTSIGRPLEPEYPTNKAVLILMPLAALLGAATSWFAGGQATQVVQAAIVLPCVEKQWSDSPGLWP